MWKEEQNKKNFMPNGLTGEPFFMNSSPHVEEQRNTL